MTFTWFNKIFFNDLTGDVFINDFLDEENVLALDYSNHDPIRISGEDSEVLYQNDEYFERQNGFIPENEQVIAVASTSNIDGFQPSFETGLD